MATARTSLFALLLLALAACSASNDSAALPGNEGTLRFAVGPSGTRDRVLLCNHGQCTTAPDNEYKTAWGLTVPVVNGRIRYVERPDLTCRYEPLNGKEHIACAARR